MPSTAGNTGRRRGQAVDDLRERLIDAITHAWDTQDLLPYMPTNRDCAILDVDVLMAEIAKTHRLVKLGTGLMGRTRGTPMAVAGAICAGKRTGSVAGGIGENKERSGRMVEFWCWRLLLVYAGLMLIVGLYGAYLSIRERS